MATATPAKTPSEPSSSLSSLRGDTEPRIFTPPLRELTPATSYGFAVIAFARDVLREPLDPWEERLVIRAGELLPSGLPRFRQVLVIVGRQNGKSHVLKVLALFWLYIEKHPLVYGISTTLALAKECWTKAVADAEAIPALKRRTLKPRLANGQESLPTTLGTRYLIGATGRNAGRGFTINRLIWDEVRQARGWETHSAIMPALSAVTDAQAWLVTNQGDDSSDVLNSTREAAINGSDPTLGIFEWSAQEGSDPLDPKAWCAANPNLGHRMPVADIASHAARAKAAGGEELARFLTERLCIRVRTMNACVDPTNWQLRRVAEPLDVTRGRVALCIDVSPDMQHATIVAASVVRPGVVRVGLAGAWSGYNAVDQLRRDLPTLLDKVKPATLGWLPGGPAAVLCADLAKPKDGSRTPLARNGMTVQEISGATVAAVCMSFAELVDSGGLEHPGDMLLDAHVLDAEKLTTGDTWRFSRRNGGRCDAAYAAAGATHLARTLPVRRSARMPKGLFDS